MKINIDAWTKACGNAHSFDMEGRHTDAAHEACAALGLVASSALELLAFTLEDMEGLNFRHKSSGLMFGLSEYLGDYACDGDWTASTYYYTSDEETIDDVGPESHTSLGRFYSEADMAEAIAKHLVDRGWATRI